MEDEPAGGRRERRDAQRNLERVLLAAHELFAERGGEVTMEEVARRAGVGVGTVYRRFASKEALFAAVSRSACTDMRHCLREVASGTYDPIGRLRALALLQYHRCTHQAALLDLHPSPTSDEQRCGTRQEQQQLYAALYDLLRTTIAEGQRTGQMRAANPDVLAAICLELLSPRTFHNLQQAIGGSPDEVAEHALSFILASLHPL